MYISKLSLVNYRNFVNTTLHFKKGVNTVLGENGSGKSNIFRALRLLLDGAMIRSAYHMDEGDFSRSIGDWRGRWIVIGAEFKDLSPDEAVQAIFLHGTADVSGENVEQATYNLIFRPKKQVRLKLAALTDGDSAGLERIINEITIDDYEAVFTGRSTIDFSDETAYKAVVGDFENVVFSNEVEPSEIGVALPSILSMSREISFTYIQALRDVVSDFNNTRTNPLRTLLKSKSGDIDPASFQHISDGVHALNGSIEALPEVKDVGNDIIQTIKSAAGEVYSPSSLTIKSDLPDEAQKLLQSLKLFVGEAGEPYEGGVHELSLGGANLIYLTLKLLEFKYQKTKPTCANFLIIEEPEAHIHNHIQKTLFDNLDYEDTQIIYSTHSTQISEVSNIENMNILGRENNSCVAFHPANQLTPAQTRNLQRYLDAIRSNLLFARSVLLVEGDAEEILIPIIVKKVLGISLDELGISLINVRSTGFENVAIIFHADRVHKNCAIITDLDASIIDVSPVPGETEVETKYREKCIRSAEVGASRRTSLDGFTNSNDWVKPFFADHTFEVDFVKSGNTELAKAMVNDVYVDATTRQTAEADLQSTNVAVYGKRILTMAENLGKGWFAVIMGNKIGHDTIMPQYIVDAIAFANPSIPTGVWHNIFEYRLKYLERGGTYSAEQITEFKAQLAKYKTGEIDFAAIRTAMLSAFDDKAFQIFLNSF